MHKVAFVVIALAGTALAKPTAEKQERVADEFDPGPSLRPRPVPVPQPPRAAAETAALGKQIAGTWHCKGTSYLPDKSTINGTGTLVIEVALDGGWLKSSFEMKVAGLTMHTASFRSYDAVAKVWTRITMTDEPAYTIDESLGDDHGTWTWAAQTKGAPNSTTEQYTKTGITLTAERSKGVKAYEVTCSR